MGYKWDKKLLCEVSEYTTGKLNSNAEVSDGEFPFFTCSPRVLKINDYAFDQDAVLLAGNNANGVFHAHRYTGKFNAYQRTYVFNTLSHSVIDNTYLYYYLIYKLNYLQSQSIGSATKYLTKKILDKIEIYYPTDFEKMEKIGLILSNIDTKIELNNKSIANLEELSQTLFKRWLIDFEFPDENGNPYKSSGGKFVDTDGFMLPINWFVEPLDNIAQYTNGLAMQKYKPKDENDKLPVVKIKELKNGFVDDSSAFCTHSIPDKVKIFNGDIVFSWSATLLVDIWTGGPAGLNQHLFKVTSDKFQKWFYYYWTSFHNKNFIEIAKDKATTMGHINRKHLKEAKVFIPEEKILQKLDYQMSLYLKEIVNINLQNKSLAELRDTLLPKLMSGEIELPDELEVDKHAELLQ